MVFPVKVERVHNEFWVWDVQPIADGELVDVVEELCDMGQVDHREALCQGGGEVGRCWAICAS